MRYTHGEISLRPSRSLRSKSTAISSEERQGVYAIPPSLFELPPVGHKLARFGIQGTAPCGRSAYSVDTRCARFSLVYFRFDSSRTCGIGMQYEVHHGYL